MYFLIHMCAHLTDKWCSLLSSEVKNQHQHLTLPGVGVGSGFMFLTHQPIRVLNFFIAIAQN